MTPELASLIAAAVVWVFVHIGIAGTTLRDRFVRVLGERGFRGAFSLVSVANIVWLGLAWGAAGPVRVLWQAPGWLVVLCILLLIPATVLLVCALTVPNPTSVAGARALMSETPAIGILRVTRYPMLWSFALWAAAHMIVIGTLGGAIFTGAFLAVAVAGMFSLDAKYARRAPEPWAAFARVTSILPFAAIRQGRNHFAFAEIGLWRMVVGVLLWFMLIALHRPVYDVNPWRFLGAG
ncbi:NnrU family protein [Lysobacter sp. CFH 32150]|uniref:NnrU family protein n=1 Tax=Lysobacter sp. CFH 32150 TaxID=2927128 RepID=UPI001FA7A4A5|nr:NnrU family protein [Lysobacter sp. CFH 32150]MCI4568519.1 NnrU family protein [Lysobacter sp. CFH 32150]